MQTTRSIAVIGRGIGGLCLAYRFMQAGLRVTVFGSRSAEQCATRVATGMSTMKGNRLASQKLFRLKQAGHAKLARLLLELEAQSGAKLIHWGVFEPFSNLGEYQQIAEKVYRRQFRGIFQNELKRAGPTGAPALYYPRDFYFDPNLMLNHMEQLLVRGGVDFKEQQINKVSTGKSGACLCLTTASGAQLAPEFDEVILAAGHGSLEILASSGFFVHSLSKVWGETLVIDRGLGQGALGLTKLGTSFTGFADHCRTGSTSESFPLTTAVDSSRAQLLARHRDLYSYETDSVRFESGLRLRTRSRLPLIGEFWFDPAGKARLRVATAFYRNGFQFADIAACFHVSQVLSRSYQGPEIPGSAQPLQILSG